MLAVVPFSPAYFAVERALPELAASLKAGDEVLIAGRKASLKVAAGGRDRLTAEEVRDFTRAFRGA